MSEMKIKPCPFCGARAKVMPWHGESDECISIGCSNDEYGDESDGCTASPSVVGDDFESALASWNRRNLK